MVCDIFADIIHHRYLGNAALPKDDAKNPLIIPRAFYRKLETRRPSKKFSKKEKHKSKHKSRSDD